MISAAGAPRSGTVFMVWVVVNWAPVVWFTRLKVNVACCTQVTVPVKTSPGCTAMPIVTGRVGKHLVPRVVADDALAEALGADLLDARSEPSPSSPTQKAAMLNVAPLPAARPAGSTWR